MTILDVLSDAPANGAIPRRSRRTVIRTLGVGGMAAVLAAGTAHGLAASPATQATPENLPTFFARFLDEWSAAAASGDATAVLPFYTQDAVFEDVPFAVVLSGPEAIGGFLAGFFGTYSDATVTWRSVIATDEAAAAEAVFEGRYTGQIPDLPPGEGQPVSVRSTHVYTFDGDLIRSQTLYFDAYGLLIQLGVLPAPEAATT